MRLNAECTIALFCQKTHEHPAVFIPPDTEIKTQTLWFWTVRIWLSCMIALKEKRLCHATFIKPRPTTFRWKYWYASELFSPQLAKCASLCNLMQCLQVHLLDLKAEVWLHSLVWGVTVGVPTCLLNCCEKEDLCTLTIEKLLFLLSDTLEVAP